MRRRTQAGFAWVSMMDLLFTLFGSLIVLTVLISTKLGAISPIEERRFHALTVEVAAPDRNSGEALVRLNIKFVIFRNGADPCQFGASIRGSACLKELGDGHGHERRLTEFATGAEAARGSRPARLTASLLITEPRREDGLKNLGIMPVLGNIAQLRDSKGIGDATEFDMRMSVKSQRGIWEVRHLKLSVKDLLNSRPKSNFGVPLLPPGIEGLVGPTGAAKCTGDCGTMEVKKGGEIVLSWH